MQDVDYENRNPEQIKQKDKGEIFKGDDLHYRIVIDVLGAKRNGKIFNSICLSKRKQEKFKFALPPAYF